MEKICSNPCLKISQSTTMIGKMSLKSSSVYSTWIRKYLGQRFNTGFLESSGINGEETTDLSILQIEYEARNLNLQASLNSLIWNSELNPVFTKLGLLLTIQMFVVTKMMMMMGGVKHGHLKYLSIFTQAYLLLLIKK